MAFCEGTHSITFKMTDLDYTTYRHGGGTVEYLGGDSIEPGVFKYSSPCPPSGKHRYKWSAWSKDISGKNLGSATATRRYPE